MWVRYTHKVRFVSNNTTALYIVSKLCQLLNALTLKLFYSDIPQTMSSKLLMLAGGGILGCRYDFTLKFFSDFEVFNFDIFSVPILKFLFWLFFSDHSIFNAINTSLKLEDEILAQNANLQLFFKWSVYHPS